MSPAINQRSEYGDADDTISYTEYLEFSRSWLQKLLPMATLENRRAALCQCLLGQESSKAKLPCQLTSQSNCSMEVGALSYHATIMWNEGNISRKTAWGSWMSPCSAPHDHCSGRDNYRALQATNGGEVYIKAHQLNLLEIDFKDWARNRNIWTLLRAKAANGWAMRPRSLV